MLIVHRKNCVAYYRKQDVRAIEHHPETIGEYKTKLVLSIIGKRESVFVSEKPQELIERINTSK